jgi:hypothetical protein
MMDSLDQDVFALKSWIDQAWRRLGQPTLTQSERGDERHQMKKANSALRLGLKQRASVEPCCANSDG